MDHESLRTASTYLNNLLLARGLLRNSEPIDFVKPSKESRAQIINLVHDLILREDRARDQQEHVAITLRTLRADEARSKVEEQRLREKIEESARATVQAQAAERVAQAEAKKVERAVKSLQDQATRLKASLAQVKTQCATDVRKRDLELARLKTHLQGQQRGNKVGMTAPSMTITGGTRSRPIADASVGLDDPEYSLKQETTEFLTQLSQSLSDENDSLISLIRGALGTIKELLGMSSSRRHPDSAIGSMGSNEDKNDANMLHTLPTAYETLAADMENAIEHLKVILSNPNFVTIEEVEVRDEEIRRLRAGWEHMERRWKDVLVMLQGWQRRMDGGDTINIDDLRRGMGLVSPGRQQNGHNDEMPEQSFMDSEISEMSEIKLAEGDVSESSIVLEPPRLSTSLGMSKSSPKRKRDVLEPPDSFDLRPASSRSHPASPQYADLEYNNNDADSSEDLEPAHQFTIAEKLSAAQAEAEEAAAARAGSRRGKRGGEGDIEAVGTRAGRDSNKRSRSRVATASTSGVGGMDGAAEAEELDDTLGKMPSPVKKTKIKGRPRRRKSTLSPEELEALITAEQ